MNRKVIAVIFSRGAGDELPMVSAHLLAGKPLLQYTVDAVRKVPGVSQVFVSTEDRRIGKLSLELGVQVLSRPKALADGKTPLIKAVEHAASSLSENLEEVGGHLLCLTADAVFCDSDLIEKVIKRYFSGNFDRLITVLPEQKKYIIWQESNSGQVELMVPPPDLRESRQELFSEPGVLTIWRVRKNGLPLVDSKVGYTVLHPKQAMRIDTEYELWLAERLIQRNRIAIRCDGSKKMGMGHVLRLAYLADHLGQQNGEEWNLRFFVGSEHLEGAEFLISKGCDVDIVKQDDCAHWVRRIDDYKPSLVISDLPSVPSKYLEALEYCAAKCLHIVDSVSDIEPSDCWLDAVISNTDEELSIPHDRYHCGLLFTPFNPSVSGRLQGSSRIRSKPSGELCVYLGFGTGDPEGLTAMALEALAETERYWGKLIVTAGDRSRALIREAKKRIRCEVIVIDVPSRNLGDILDEVDLALVSGGMTTYETSALGIPSIVLCQNERELFRMQLFEKKGSVLLLGLGREVEKQYLVSTLGRLAGDFDLRRQMSEAGSRITDGDGIRRITTLLLEMLNSDKDSQFN